MRARAYLGLLAALTAGALASGVGVGGASAAATVTCPTLTASGGAVQWAFSVIGAPTAGGPAGLSSWTRGDGNWTAGRASGAICVKDSGGGLPERRLVLAPSGSSTLSPHITEHGLLGVGLVIAVKVAATDDSACPTGSTGTVTLFASYYSVHTDSIATHFHSGCAGHNQTFTGAIVKVEISKDGAQVNSA